MGKRIPLAGYVLDGLVLVAARVNAADEIVTEVTAQPIDGIPSLMAWFTKRRVENAMRRAQKAGQPVNVDLSAMAFSYLEAELRKDPKAKARLTADHIHHLLTAGKNYDIAQIDAAKLVADAYLQRLEDAVTPAVAVAAA